MARRHEVDARPTDESGQRSDHDLLRLLAPSGGPRVLAIAVVLAVACLLVILLT